MGVVIVQLKVFPGERLNILLRRVDCQRLHGTAGSNLVTAANSACSLMGKGMNIGSRHSTGAAQEAKGSLGKAAAGSEAAPSEARRGWCRHGHRPAHAQTRLVAARIHVLSCTCARQATVKSIYRTVAVNNYAMSTPET